MHVKYGWYTEWMDETGKHDSELMNLFPICMLLKALHLYFFNLYIFERKNCISIVYLLTQIKVEEQLFYCFAYVFWILGDGYGFPYTFCIWKHRRIAKISFVQEHFHLHCKQNHLSELQQLYSIHTGLPPAYCR